MAPKIENLKSFVNYATPKNNVAQAPQPSSRLDLSTSGFESGSSSGIVARSPVLPPGAGTVHTEMSPEEPSSRSPVGTLPSPVLPPRDGAHGDVA